MEVLYASITRRSVAAGVDSVIFLLFGLIVIYPVYGRDYLLSPNLVEGPLDFFVAWVFPAVATIIFWQRYGATPGKMAVSIRVVDAATGSAPGYRKSLYRYLGYFLGVFTLGLSVIWMVFDSKGRTLHDKLAGTLVIKTENATHFKEPLFRYVGGVFSVLMILIVFASPVQVFLAQLGIVPKQVVIAGEELSNHAYGLLRENEILEEGEQVRLFYADDPFSFLEDGNILTDKRVISYWMEDDVLQIEEVDIRDIQNIEFIAPVGIFDNSTIQVGSDTGWLLLYVSPYKELDKLFFRAIEKSVEDGNFAES